VRWLSLVVHAAALLPLALLIRAYWQNLLGPDAVAEATRRSGRYALAFLMLSLTPTVVARVIGYRDALRVRRALGLYGFMYAALHFLVFTGLDYGFDFGLIRQAVQEGRLVQAGLVALITLVPLAVTSTRGWMRRLGRNWKRLHRLSYVAAGLAVLHYAWRFKELRTTPLLVGAALLLLLIARFPPVARMLANWRSRVWNRASRRGGTRTSVQEAREMRPIYLDYNATTPIAPEVAEAMEPYLHEEFGNPSSGHPYGIAARQALDTAREQVAELLGCQLAEVVFTSGGTESNNHAIRGAAHAYRTRGNHLITTAVEHPAITDVCDWLETQGFRVTVLPVDDRGLVDPADLERVITSDTVLVTVMHANNEVGTIQPIAELAEIAHHYGALMHTDAAQSVGKLPVNVDALGVDLLTVAGHKLYAPKGTGALYIRGGVELARLLHGAGQEGGRRPGTENVLEIVGLGRACQMAGRDLEGDMAHFQAMRDRLHAGLLRRLGDGMVRLNGHPENRLPNTLSLSFRGIEANRLLSEISQQVAASAGAACHADEVDVSAVIRAMGVPLDWAMGTVRFSVGRGTTVEEVDRATQVVAEMVQRMQSSSTPISGEDDEGVWSSGGEGQAS